jgi:hypothetical protein
MASVVRLLFWLLFNYRIFTLATTFHPAQTHLLMAVQISPENRGLRNLQDLMDEVRSVRYKADVSVPIVLVPGFGSWGEPLFGTFNYWGGFEDLPAALNAAGYTVIVVRIGPLSSNWKRACEVYAQLTSG